ncbi:dihydrodipicolinate reductase [Primorskyibacter sp. S187A]|uniref:dihydrodipicolinate reductase n=1 Tax=Primorskyibacter sp. S187A TaxID=3415130 RepID=UPI003C7A9CBD
MAQAELATVKTKQQFVELIAGKTLSRPFVKLQVTPNGSISGRGARWDVEGNWTWQDGYFCRDLFWGGDPLGYNCQEVRANGNRVRFTSDRGAGDSAEFRLR